MNKIGKYDIIEFIGSGGFGDVYKAKDPVLQRAVAIKIMKAEFKNEKAIFDTFQKEAILICNINDINIVEVYDFSKYRGRPYIVMEFLTGVDLTHIIADKVNLPMDRKADILVQTTKGLMAAHGQNIIHRDIKPGNIRLLDNNTVKIMDFGIARDPTSGQTTTGHFAGTISYMSPEQIDRQSVGKHSDLYSLGVVAYELIAYRHPFPGNNPLDVMEDILQKPPAPLNEIRDRNYFFLEDIVLKLLEKNPGDRFRTAEELLQALEAGETVEPKIPSS
ncbi:serine/threonine protein kinase, partial [Acidobacteriota bacterium]